MSTCRAFDPTSCHRRAPKRVSIDHPCYCYGAWLRNPAPNMIDGKHPMISRVSTCFNHPFGDAGFRWPIHTMLKYVKITLRVPIFLETAWKLSMAPAAPLGWSDQETVLISQDPFGNALRYWSRRWRFFTPLASLLQIFGSWVHWHQLGTNPIGHGGGENLCITLFYWLIGIPVLDCCSDSLNQYHSIQPATH